MSDPARPTPLPALTGFSSYVNELNYGKDGTRLAAGSSDNSVRVVGPPNRGIDRNTSGQWGGDHRRLQR